MEREIFDLPIAASTAYRLHCTEPTLYHFRVLSLSTIVTPRGFCYAASALASITLINGLRAPVHADCASFGAKVLKVFEANPEKIR